MPLYPNLLKIVESICTDGCESVRSIILEAENGNLNARIAALPEDEQKIVLAELKAIMAVYDKPKSSY